MERPEYFQTAGFFSQSDSNKTAGGNGDHFVVEDLLDFSQDDDVLFTDSAFDNQTGSSTDSSTLTVLDTCNSSFSGCEPASFLTDVNFPGDLCVPYDDLAELEWLSGFVEESFSTDDLENLSLISGVSSSKPKDFPPELRRSHPEIPVPAKAARSKRSRAAPCIWNSHLSVLSPTTSSSEPEALVTAGKKAVKSPAKKKEDSDEMTGGDGRRCLHCATDKTPQWRTGPMGPKTLCNACGVRYKSGRLVPEYRPAASPTFVLTKHSNSHRKVLELRRQKEMMSVVHHQQQYLHQENMVFNVSNEDDYLIHQHMGPNLGDL